MAPAISHGVRSLAPALAGADDPRSELLALIWGPRFDREHAWQLAAPLAAPAAQALQAAADRFDALDTHQQQRLRRLAVGARRTHNAACRASC